MAKSFSRSRGDNTFFGTIMKKLVLILKMFSCLIYFISINFISLISLFYQRKRNHLKAIKSCENILNKKNSNCLMPLLNVVREEMSLAYAGFLKDTVKDDAFKIINARPLMRKWLNNELRLYRHRTNNISLWYLLKRMHVCYKLLSNFKCSIQCLKRLQLLNPNSEEVKVIIKYEEKLLEFDRNYDYWEILAFPDKDKIKHEKLIRYINKFGAAIIQEYDPWALSDRA